MREIMAQASSTRSSALSMSLSAQKAKDSAVKQTAPKLSQKERKKQQQQVQQTMARPQISLDIGDGKPSSPWQVAGTGPKTSLKDVLKEPSSSPSTAVGKSLGTPVSPKPSTPRRAASPDTRFAGQSRIPSNRNLPKSQASQPSSTKSLPIVPHSRTYTTPTGKAEPSLQFSMADIIGQQRREREVIKEAVAKRSLQEIQEEQAFQEWWDQESKRAQEEEAARPKNASSSRAGKSGRSGKGGRGRGKGRGGGGIGGGASEGESGKGRGRAEKKEVATQ
jgi:hypothetical protein